MTGEGGAVLAEQQVFGGSTIVRSKVSTGTPIITVRPNSVPAEQARGAAERVDVAVELSEAAKAARIVDRVVEEKGEPPGADRGRDRGLRRPWRRVAARTSR